MHRLRSFVENVSRDLDHLYFNARIKGRFPEPMVHIHNQAIPSMLILDDLIPLICYLLRSLPLTELQFETFEGTHIISRLYKGWNQGLGLCKAECGSHGPPLTFVHVTWVMDLRLQI